jgi:hypothetical protein
LTASSVATAARAAARNSGRTHLHRFAILVSLVLAAVILVGCTANDPIAVYRDYRAIYAKGDMDRTLRFLPQKDRDVVHEMSVAYQNFCAWVDANRQTISGWVEGPDLIKAAQEFAKLNSDGEVFKYHMRIASITGCGEPAEIPASVDVSGDSATLTFPEGQTRSMVKENGVWLVCLLPAVEKDLQNSKKQLETVLNKIPAK